MSRDDIQKLLGGYATGTLTSEEQAALFAAALDDQELFDALAREQSLRDLLRDPSAKAHLLTALHEKPKTGWALWWRPTAVGLTMAAVAVLVVVMIRQRTPTAPAVTVAIAEPKADALLSTAAPPPQEAESERRRAKDTDSPAAGKPAPEKKFAAKEKLAEVDAATAAPSPARDERVAAAGVLGGVAPQEAQQTVTVTATPPPPEPKAETAAPAPLAAAKRSDAPALARARLSARLIFLSQTPAIGMMKSGYVANPPGQESQARQQSPAAPAQQQQGQFGARESVQLVDSKMLAPPPQAGVRYTVVGTTVRLETNEYGYVYAMARGDSGTWRPVFSSAAQPLQQYVITTLRPDEKEVFIAFSRAVEFAKAGPASPQPGDEPATNLVEKEGDTTYVVNPLPEPAGRQVSFTIRLP